VSHFYLRHGNRRACLPHTVRHGLRPSLFLTLILFPHLLAATRPQVSDGISWIFLCEILIPDLPGIPCVFGLDFNCISLNELGITRKLLIKRGTECLELNPLQMVVRFDLVANARAPAVVDQEVTLTSVLAVFQVWDGRRFGRLGSVTWD
jgi:hypothetical protein